MALFVEQGQLQAFRSADAALAEGGYPVPAGLTSLRKPGLGGQAAVSYEHDAPEAELLLGLGNLRSQCIGIGRKDFHGHGAAVFAREQAEDDLLLAFFLVPGVAILGQLKGFAFDVGGGNIRGRALLEVLASEALFDSAFSLQQSIHGLVEVVLVYVFETEFATERMAGGVWVQACEFAYWD